MDLSVIINISILNSNRVVCQIVIFYINNSRGDLVDLSVILNISILNSNRVVCHRVIFHINTSRGSGGPVSINQH